MQINFFNFIKYFAAVVLPHINLIGKDCIFSFGAKSKYEATEFWPKQRNLMMLSLKEVVIYIN